MIKTTRFDPVDYLQDEQDIAIYLEEAAKQSLKLRMILVSY